MTEVLMLYEVPFWVLPAPGPSSSKTKNPSTTLHHIRHVHSIQKCMLSAIYNCKGNCLNCCRFVHPSCPPGRVSSWWYWTRPMPWPRMPRMHCGEVSHLFGRALPTVSHTAHWAARQFGCWWITTYLLVHPDNYSKKQYLSEDLVLTIDLLEHFVL